MLCRRSRVPIDHDEIDDHGVSLIEVLIAIVLLGLGGIATMSALGGALSGSSVHEHKVVGLSVLETAAAAITEPLDDCSAYEGVAKNALPADAWGQGGLGAPDAVTVTANCSGDLHVIQLRYDSPSGRTSEVLWVSVGGPSVLTHSATPPDGSDADQGGAFPPTGGDTTCRITSVGADPPTMTWWPGEDAGDPWGKLDQDIALTATTTGNCANLRAVIEPEPDAELLYLPLNAVEGAQGTIRAVVNGRELGSRWGPGVAVARFEHEITIGAWSSMQAGMQFPLFTVDECVVTGALVANGSTTLNLDGRLSSDLQVSIAAAGACSDVRLSVDTGLEPFSTNVSVADGVLTAVVPGSPSGPGWTPGMHVLDMSKSRIETPDEVLGSLNIVIDGAEHSGGEIDPPADPPGGDIDPPAAPPVGDTEPSDPEGEGAGAS